MNSAEVNRALMDASGDLKAPANSPKPLLEHRFSIETPDMKPSNRPGSACGRPSGAREIKICFCAHSAQFLEETTGCRNRCSQSSRNARNHDSEPGYDVSSPIATGINSRGGHPSGLCRRLLVFCCEAGFGGSVRTARYAPIEDVLTHATFAAILLDSIDERDARSIRSWNDL